MSTIVDGAAGRRARPARRAGAHTSFFGGIAWIVVVAVLLAGIVAVNVIVLQLNMQFDRLGSERVQLLSDTALLRSQLSSASANLRIENAATSKLGLTAADPLTITYVQLPAK